VADTGDACRLVLLDGTRNDARVVRVGQDFAEILPSDARTPLLVRFDSIAAVTAAAGVA
jgi:hypothetical protein